VGRACRAGAGAWAGRVHAADWASEAGYAAAWVCCAVVAGARVGKTRGGRWHLVEQVAAGAGEVELGAEASEADAVDIGGRGQRGRGS
jgi:hypothetical protein